MTTKHLRTCLTQETLFLYSVFSKIGAGKGWLYDYSGCPQDPWIAKMAQSTYNDKVVVLMNVGFNKGYNFAHWINLFSPLSNITGPVWYENARKAGVLSNSADDCGWCDDCKVSYFLKPNHSSLTAKKRIMLLGVDLNELNHEMVNKILEYISSNKSFKTDSISIHLKLAGVSNENSNFEVPRCKAGDELCHLPSKKMQNLAVVKGSKKHIQLLTLENAYRTILANISDLPDTLRESLSKSDFDNGTTLIDMLYVDVEGFDALVMQGARKLFMQKTIRLVRFEYNMIPPWKHMQLKNIVFDLDVFGYECFFEGQERLWYISGSCWHDSWEFHMWSNVLCIKRNDNWLRIAEQYIVTKTSLLATYEGKILQERKGKTIYNVKNGTLRSFKDSKQFLSKGHAWDEVIQVDKGITEILFQKGLNIE